MRDYSYNKLFDFIKSKFSSDEAEDWNTPPDFIFDNAIKKIDQQNKRRRYLWYRRMGVVSIIFLIFSSLLYLNLKIDNVEAKIISEKIEGHKSPSMTTEEADSDIITTKEIIVKSESNTEAYQVKENFEISKSISEYTHKDVVPQSNTLHTGSKMAKLSDTETAKTRQQEIPEIISLIGETSYETVNGSNNEKRVDITSINQLQSGIKAIPVSNDKNIKLKLLPALSTELDIINEVLPVSIGFRVNSNFSAVSMKNILMNEDVSLTGYEKYCSGYGASVDVAKAISNRVSIKAAGQFQKINNNSLLQETSLVDVNNYSVDSNGVGAYETGMTISTPLGNYTSDISFPLDESTLNAKESMVNKTTTAQSLSYIALDLGLQYTINPKSRSAFYIGAGIGANKTISMSNHMETDIYMDDKLIDHLSAEPKSLDDLKSSFWSYYGEAGVAYALNRNSDLSMFINQRTSLSSVKDSGVTGSETYLNQINIGVGYNIRF